METAKHILWLAVGGGAVASGILCLKHGQSLVGVAAIVLGAAEVYGQGVELYHRFAASSTTAAAGAGAAAAIA